MLYHFVFTVKNNQALVICYFFYDFWLVFVKAGSGCLKLAYLGFRVPLLVQRRGLVVTGVDIVHFIPPPRRCWKAKFEFKTAFYSVFS